MLSLSLLKIKLFITVLIVSSFVQAESFDRVGDNELSFFSYKPIYFGSTTYHSDSNNTGESKYQFSFKYELFHESSIYMAYTQKTIWSTQAAAGPIKETNFTPEVFYGLKLESDVVPYIQFGIFKHHSNGEEKPNNLYWNTNYIEPLFKYEEYTIRLTIWSAFLFQSKGSASGGNGQLFEYYGKGEIEVAYDMENGDKHTILYREGSIGGVYALKYQWEIDINNLFGGGVDKNGWNTKFFVQAFNGYGETLANYNNSVTRVTVGISITQ